MMKFIGYIIFLLSVACFGCENRGLRNDFALAQTTESISQNIIYEDTIFYSDVDNKRQHDSEIVFIENEEYHLDIYYYSLNDSLIRQEIMIDGEYSGKLVPATQVYHNYEAELLLGKVNGDPYTVFRKKLNKEIFKDSLDEEFYSQARIFSVKYAGVRTNRVYFDVILSMPDSDWQEEFKCAIFFRTKKISQLDYWKS